MRRASIELDFYQLYIVTSLCRSLGMISLSELDDYIEEHNIKNGEELIKSMREELRRKCKDVQD